MFVRINLKQDLLLQHSINIRSFPCWCPVKCRVHLDLEAIHEAPSISLIRNLLRLCFCHKKLCKERKGSRGEAKEQKPASWLSMINKRVKEGCTIGRGRKEVIMWQRMIFLLKIPLGTRKQENMRIPPVHTVTLKAPWGTH